ncbi:MAG TPA: hypothetical protein VLZ89_10925 [Anaerolineales bacterium]|nr:hypothetical protein [Anaerolineales bacterium]
MRPFRHQTALYLLAFLLALAVRLIRLGTWTLTDLEAQWALQALGVAHGTHPALGSQPAYVLLTVIFFFFYGGGTNFLARLVPALAGSCLVFVPFLFRERLKPRPSLILAFFLAADPGLVALSRQAGSSILAVTFLLFGWAFWDRKRPRLAGIFAALALLSGATIWEGLLGLGLAWGIRQAVEARGKTEPASHPARSEWLSAFGFGIGTLLVGGTLFFLAPNGLSAWLSSLPEYLGGWLQPSGISAGLLLLALIAYQPLGVILASITVVRGWRNGSRRVRGLSLWALVALLLALFYPFHQVSDLVWMLIPLWSLAALELARALNIRPSERRQVVGVAGLTLFILFFVWLQFLSLTTLPFPSSMASDRIWLLGGSLALLVICILLVAAGWSARAARLGATWGIAAALGIYSFGAMLGAGNLRVTLGQEMWTADRTPAQADLLLTVTDEMSDWSMDNINAQPITIVGVDSPALEWLLRGHPISAVSTLGASPSAPFVITGGQNNPVLAAGYRGESFVWRQASLWNSGAVSDWMNWLAYHQMPQSSETIILWVRNDLFLDTTGTKP